MKRSPRQTELLQSTLGHALEFLENLDEAPVAPISTLEELRSRLNRELPTDPCAAREVIDQLVNDTKGGLTHNEGGRFFAWVIGARFLPLSPLIGSPQPGIKTPACSRSLRPPRLLKKSADAGCWTC
ncbi:MAG: hypothetical protein QNK90_02000 [Opitutaceae bacterium]